MCSGFKNVQSIQIKDPIHTCSVKSKIAPSMKERTYAVHLCMKKRDTSINHVLYCLLHDCENVSYDEKLDEL